MLSLFKASGLLVTDERRDGVHAISMPFSAQGATGTSS